MPIRKKEEESARIREMQQQLSRLQERRKELEQSRGLDGEEMLDQPILPHLTEIMRDRRLAQIRLLVQRNMHAIDKDIKEAINRLGTAIRDDEDPKEQPINTQKRFPDLIPRQSTPACSLPSPGSTPRQVLLEAVKETLGKRVMKLNSKPIVTPVSVSPVERVRSPRVGLYSFQHDHQIDKTLGRLTVQQLPSVTIQSDPLPTSASRSQVIDVQSRSLITTPGDESCSSATEAASAASGSIEANTILPEDVARIISEILAGELDLVVDAFDAVHHDHSVSGNTAPGSMMFPDSKQLFHSPCDGEHSKAASPLAIDTCTQTPIRNVKNSPTMMSSLKTESRAVGPSPEVEEEESLTPPRLSINIAPDQAPPDLSLWRRRYPPSPPESVINAPEHDRDATPTASMTTTTSNSSSDATGISSSSHSASVGSVSWLSEGEVPNRVSSPGFVHSAHRSAITDRSDAASFSEGQVLLVPIKLALTPVGGSSDGEILENLPFSATSPDSTASFRSAAGSPGEAESVSTADELAEIEESK